ncbi:hypothetical protein DDW13_08475 [Acidianus hospitalis]|jgi:Icc-related predicted phosphoesterase|uniref:Phosphoesterase n=1 Tax=Acidianus hospitalis TaxID=563177 RepID=A0A2T9X2B7_9CREN|nr:hypothetical protein DDW13_08475 [Acidianus hospitalis]
MKKLAMITRFPCQEDAVEYINNNFDGVIGLGDVECPQYLNNFHGILGEMESVYIMKYLKKTERLITKEFLGLSTDFSTEISITHFPPKGFKSGIIINVEIGKKEISAKILSSKTKIVIHGHSENQTIVNSHGFQVISIGAFEKGYLAIYYPEEKKIELSKISSH